MIASAPRLAGRGVVPGLGTVLVGDDGPSARYVAMKHADCAALGITSAHVHLPADATQADVEGVVDRFNADPAVHAYLMQYRYVPTAAEGRRSEREVHLRRAAGQRPVPRPR